MSVSASLGQLGLTLADSITDLRNVGVVAQAVASILAGVIAVLGVPLTLRQIFNLQREFRRYDVDRSRRYDAETTLNITARYSLSHAADVSSSVGQSYSSPDARMRRQQEVRTISAQPSPAPEPGKRVLRLDLALENVGEGTLDILGCLVSARELERQGDEVIAGGRDAQWDDLTPHYWDSGEHSFSPGLSTTKHIVYAQDALARVKAHSRKTLARIDQIRALQGGPDIYLLYRAFVVARRAARGMEDVQAWMA